MQWLYSLKDNHKNIPDISKYTQLIDTSTLSECTSSMENRFNKCNTCNEKSFYRDMKDITSKVFSLVRTNTITTKGFAILGFDFIISSYHKVYLLEINKSPALYSFDNIYRRLIHKNLEDTLFESVFNTVFIGGSDNFDKIDFC